MENRSKLSAEDLRKLQKGIIEELSRRDNEAWDIAADKFKQAYEDLLLTGLGAPEVMVGIINTEWDVETVEYAEVLGISVDKTNKKITIEVEDVGYE